MQEKHDSLRFAGISDACTAHEARNALRLRKEHRLLVVLTSCWRKGSVTHLRVAIHRWRAVEVEGIWLPRRRLRARSTCKHTRRISTRRTPLCRSLFKTTRAARLSH